MDPAPVSPDEVREFASSIWRAFHGEMKDVDLDRWERVVEPERTLAMRDRGRIVAGTGIFSRRLAVPGGVVPAAAVTLVGVLPTHRRRGLMSTLMRRQLADVHEAGREAVAALWASEAVIYGRFGYGLATIATQLDVARRSARLRRPSDARVDLLAPGRRAARDARGARGAAGRRSRGCSTATDPGGRTASRTTRSIARAPSRCAPP